MQHIKIDTVISLSSAANPPTHSTHQLPPSIHVTHQRSPAVPLAGIDLASVMTSTAHARCETTVNVTAGLLANQRYFGLL